MLKDVLGYHTFQMNHLWHVTFTSLVAEQKLMDLEKLEVSGRFAWSSTQTILMSV